MKLAVLFLRFGPYHVARLKSAARLGTIIGIELSGSGGDYAWNSTESDGFERVTVYPEGDLNGLSSRRRNELIHSTLDGVQPDVLAIAGYADRGMLAAAAWGMKNRKPLVLMSDSHADSGKRTFVKEWLKRRLVQFFGSALVAGSKHADYLQSLGMNRERIFDGYDVIDNDYFANQSNLARHNPDLREKLSLPDRYFLISARFVEKKNLSMAIGAYAKYRAESLANPWHLVLVGDGPLRTQLEARARELNVLPFVHFAGFQQYEELPAYYGLASAFILPSMSEEWGLVVNEAMASGLPVIVSRVCGCVPDLVRDDWNGQTFNPSDPAELAQAMGTLSNNPAMSEAKGVNSRVLIRDWSLHRFSHNLWEAARLAKQRTPSTISRTLLSMMIR